MKHLTSSYSSSYSVRAWLAVCAVAVCGCAGFGETASPAVGQSEDPTASAPLRAGFLIVDGVYNTELMAPYDVFEHTRHHDPEGQGIEVFTISPDGEEIVTAEGIRIRPHYSFMSAPPLDILIVPSAEGSRDRDLENDAMIQWVAETGRDAPYVMSLCWGAFVLAKAGLLEDRAATTFPSDYGRFAATFPQVDLRFNVSFVHDRDRLTSQGGAKSYEVAMYLVDHLFGESVATGVGSGLLIPWPPSPRPDIIAEPKARC